MASQALDLGSMEGREGKRSWGEDVLQVRASPHVIGIAAPSHPTEVINDEVLRDDLPAKVLEGPSVSLDLLPLEPELTVPIRIDARRPYQALRSRIEHQLRAEALHGRQSHAGTSSTS
jgi:hypothetical protein